jgi:hypothetical protein
MTSTETPRPWRSKWRRRAIVLFVLLLPVAAWTLWDYIEARRLSSAVREIQRRGEPITTLKPQTRVEDSPKNAARYYDAAGSLLDRTPLYVNQGKDSITLALRYDRGERSEVIGRIRKWLDENAEAERLLELATDLEFTGFQPGTEYNFRFDRMWGLATLAEMRRLERLDARDGDRAARAVVMQVRIARTGQTSRFNEIVWWGVERSVADAGAVLDARPSEAALAQLAGALAEQDRDSAIEEAALRSRAYLIDSFWNQGSDWYGRPAMRFGGNPLEPVAYLLVRPWFAHKVNAELRLLNAAIEQARKPWPERAAFGADAPAPSPARFLFLRFDHPAQVMSALHRSQVRSTARMLAVLRASEAAVAIERYRLAHAGAPPARLEDLVPALLPRVPVDPFSAVPLQYKRLGDRYIVYSFGTNQKDDGGMQLKGPTPKTGARDQLDTAPDIGVQVTLKENTK